MRSSGQGINLHRAAWGHFITQATANHNTWALKNNAPTVELLLLWRLIQDTNNFGDSWNFSVTQNLTLLTPVSGTPVIPTDPTPPGQIGYVNTIASLPNNFQMTPNSIFELFPNVYPFAVIPPGWAFCIQDSTALGGPIGASAFWEAITPEEFEYLYGDTGLAVKRSAGAI